MSGKKAPPGSLIQHITPRIENKSACKTDLCRTLCRAVKFPANQHRMIFGLTQRERGRCRLLRGERGQLESSSSKGDGGQGAIVQLGVGGCEAVGASQENNKHSTRSIKKIQSHTQIVLVGGWKRKVPFLKNIHKNVQQVKCSTQNQCGKIQTWWEICSHSGLGFGWLSWETRTGRRQDKEQTITLLN